jgi:hypothetical protein
MKLLDSIRESSECTYSEAVMQLTGKQNQNEIVLRLASIDSRLVEIGGVVEVINMRTTETLSRVDPRGPVVLMSELAKTDGKGATGAEILEQLGAPPINMLTREEVLAKLPEWIYSLPEWAKGKEPQVVLDYLVHIKGLQGENPLLGKEDVVNALSKAAMSPFVPKTGPKRPPPPKLGEWIAEAREEKMNTNGEISTWIQKNRSKNVRRAHVDEAIGKGA